MGAFLVHTLILPIHIQVSSKRRFLLNLNQYRNTHFQVLNKAKILFKEQIQDQVLALPAMKKIAVSYTLYPRTKQLCDISNVCSIVDKFFCDALSENGRIPDDNYQFVLGVQYLFGAVDPSNPRVEARITPHE